MDIDRGWREKGRGISAALLMGLLCVAAAQARTPVPRDLQPLSGVKITGKVRHAAQHPNTMPPEALRPPDLEFQTWLVDHSLVVRVCGVRMETRRKSPPRRMGSIEFGDASDYEQIDVPYTFAIAYQPDDLNSSTDFPVRYFDSDKGTGHLRVRNMSTLSPLNSPWYPHWLLQRVALAAQERPTAAAADRTVEDGYEVLKVSMPPKQWEPGQWESESISCTFRGDALVCDHSSEAWTEGGEQHDWPLQTIAYSDFDPRFPAVARRVEISPTRGGSQGMPWVAEVTAIEELPRSATFESIVREAGKGLPRLFSQLGRSDELPLSGTALRRLDRGGEIRLADYARKFVLLHFWASWAPENAERFAEIRNIRKRHAANPEFVVISISLDADPDEAQKAIRSLRPDWPQAFLGGDAEAARRFPFRNLPAAMLVEPASKSPANDPHFEGTKVIFGGEPNEARPKLQPSAVVADRLAIEARRRKAGGIYRELFGEAGRNALRNPNRAQGYLLSGARIPIREERVEIPPGAQRIAGSPVLYQWPDLPRDAVRELSGLLLEDGSYGSRADLPDGLPEEAENLIGLRFAHRGDRLEVAYHRALKRIDIAVERDGHESFWRVMKLGDGAAERLERVLEKWMPEDQRAREGAEQTFAAWRERAVRREQDQDTEKSSVAPIRMTAVWPGREAIQLEWLNPDRRQVMIVKGETRDFYSIPEHGQSYSGGNRIGDGWVVYSGTGDRHLDRKLQDGRFYYYKVYAVGDGNVYSAAPAIRASAGDGIRITDLKTLGETQSSDPERTPGLDPREYEPILAIGYDSEFLLRLVGQPAQKEVPLKYGEATVLLREDEHAPVGGAATYTARMHYASDQRTTQQEL